MDLSLYLFIYLMIYRLYYLSIYSCPHRHPFVIPLFRLVGRGGRKRDVHCQRKGEQESKQETRSERSVKRCEARVAVQVPPFAMNVCVFADHSKYGRFGSSRFWG